MIATMAIDIVILFLIGDIIKHNITPEAMPPRRPPSTRLQASAMLVAADFTKWFGAVLGPKQPPDSFL